MAHVDERPDVKLTPYRDGPLLVRGPITVVDTDGTPVEVTRDPVALCRCGASRMKPFCDGSHKLIGFSAPSAAEKPAAGGGRFPRPTRT
jgi:CDGSH-type Zn-finger protein